MLYLVFVRYLYDCKVTILGSWMHRRCRRAPGEGHDRGEDATMALERHATMQHALGASGRG